LILFDIFLLFLLIYPPFTNHNHLHFVYLIEPHFLLRLEVRFNSMWILVQIIKDTFTLIFSFFEEKLRTR